MSDFVLKLRNHVKASVRQRHPMLKNRDAAYVEFLGRNHYSEADGKRRYLNLVNRWIKVMIPHVASANPEHECESDIVALRGEAVLRSLYLDKLADDLDRVSISRLMLLDAMLSPYSVARMGIRTTSDLVKRTAGCTTPGLRTSSGFRQGITLSIPALCAGKRSGGRAISGTHPATLLESGLFNNKIVEKLPTLSTTAQMARSDRGADHLNPSVSDSERHDIEERIELCDLAIYDEMGGATLIVTMAMTGVPEFLRIEEYEGWNRGPYEWLQFAPLPDQLYGEAPVSVLLENAEAFTAVTGKMVDMAPALKVVFVADDDVDEEDITTLRLSKHNDFQRVRGGPNAVGALQLGNIPRELGDFATIMQGWNEIQANNPAMLAGGASGSGSATEFAGRQANAGTITDDYQRIHERFENRVSGHLNWYAGNDPLLSLPLTHRLPGGEFVQVRYTPSQARGDNENFRIRLKRRTMMRRDPNVEANNLLNMMQTIFMGAQIAAQTGLIKPDGVARQLGAAFGQDRAHEIVNDPVLEQINQQVMSKIPPDTKGEPSGVVANAPSLQGLQGNMNGQVQPSRQTTGSGRPIDQVQSAIRQQAG